VSHRGTLFVITAPSGAGKTSLVKALVDRVEDLSVSISHTTRPKRPAEVHEVSYYFVDAPEFQRMVEAGEFLEHAEVYGNHYGTSRGWVERTLADGQDVILEIDWQGAEATQALMPESVSIFVLPPSIEALAERLGARQQDPESVIEGRLAEATADVARYSSFDFLVLNADFDQALSDIEVIVRAERLKKCRSEKKHQQLLAELLKTE